MLKNALDWTVGSGSFDCYPVGIIGASPSSGASVRPDLIRTLTWQGAHVIGHLGIPSAKAKPDDQGSLADSVTLNQLEDFFASFSSVWQLDAKQRMQAVYDVTRKQGIDDGNVALIHA